MNKKLFLLIYSLLILFSFSKRILKEEDSEEEEQANDCEGEETCEKEKEKEAEFSKISTSNILKENMPHSKVILPIRRIGTSNMQMGEAPCGGIEKKSANTLTTKGSSINVIWEVVVPENSGNCTVKISNGLQDEENFVLLKPVNEKLYGDGSFKCGREKGFETKEFILPDDYECDGCTLQWKWSTSYGEIYSCSDIIINGGNLNKCMGKCLNGGSCFNGNCLCLDGFSGEFCEDKEGKTSLKWLWILLGLVFLGIAIYLIYKFRNEISSLFKSTQTWLYKDKKYDIPAKFHEDKDNNQNIVTSQLQPNSNYKDE